MMGQIPSFIQLGDEGVRSAARQMESAAERMEKAATNIDYSLDRFMDRFEAAITTLEQWARKI